MVLNSPRISAGASGLGSNVSMMARAALHPHQDAVDVLAAAGALAWRPRRLQAEEVRQRQAKGGQAADAEELTAGDAGTIRERAVVEVEHGRRLPNRVGHRQAGGCGTIHLCYRRWFFCEVNKKNAFGRDQTGGAEYNKGVPIAHIAIRDQTGNTSLG